MPSVRDRQPASAASLATRALQRRAHELIPGGSHTYSKGDEQYPENAPPFIARGEGCHGQVARSLFTRESLEQNDVNFTESQATHKQIVLVEQNDRLEAGVINADDEVK
ncbi:MAG TPA: hypothetical protein DGB72_11660 [Gemmatimonadetes bacterium]|nr:hypothetical protein [Gemmatimonadota bacterium]